MTYVSTRGGCAPVSASKAILDGIAPDGGLYTPSEIPEITEDMLGGLCRMDYRERAKTILSMYLSDYTDDELAGYIGKAYASFDCGDVAPVARCRRNAYVLELFHGPTCAFKDMALQLLPYLLTAAIKKNSEKAEVCILVATSGDTGKAALEGFRDVDGTSIIVFYPRNGVSEVQRLQMTTQKGANVRVCAVDGNFDDAQTGVKDIFSDSSFAAELKKGGVRLSSANSINWGRLVPQIVYYVSAYCDLVNRGAVRMGEAVNAAVPTGNFGDILAAYYARRMGVPIKTLICASNSNNVLTDFINTGVYDKNREFHLTSSPSMDILVSSNVERLIFELNGHDGEKTAAYMKSLRETGRYELGASELVKLGECFAAGFAGEAEVRAAIRGNYDRYDYLSDPHTAVGACVLEKYLRATGDKTLSLVVSTAHPYKFCDTVLRALTGEVVPNSPELFKRLEGLSGNAVPAPLAELENAEERFAGCVAKDGMEDEVRSFVRSRLGG